MKIIIVNNLYKASNLALLTVPLLYGCNGGGGGSSGPVGGLFSPTSPAAGTGESLLASVPDLGMTSGMATVHNPEPATMLLLGGGMLAMGFIKSRKNVSKSS